ncbi:MFS transporter [Rossellomorea aquimaris]|jgi:MFS transporter, YQGE family, putative transporter|uniref:MFS transporter n=1 Tax=Rossellomorea aquimaris TaxID=189382 RepID=A0A5D4UH15_9BACI|nr:MFS transporter [Rossellomorea aquimaris]TYS77655.1 MFS transporter [Rossellomorea aquimaris]TYS86837.1 MFS transporter [Rossellomorea aquimaris]
MSSYKKLLGDIDLTRDLTLLLLIGGLYSLSIALSNTFVNIYLWKQSGEFIDLGIYNLTVVIFQPLTFILAGRWAKKVDRVIVLRFGVIFLALFYISVLSFGESAENYLVVLGALLGIGYGFYWLAFNVLTFEITEPETRDFFNGFLGTLTSAGGMIGPILAGFIISRFASYKGYTIVFGLSLLLFAVAVLLSFFLKRRPASGRYLFLRILEERKNNANWRFITNAHFFQGLREGTFIFIISVFVFISTGSEFAIGTFGLINSGIAFVGYYIASRVIKKKFRKKAILLGGILLYLAIFLIVFDVTYTKLLLYAGMIAIAYPILLVPYISMTYDVIGTGWNAAEMRIEYIVVREIFLNSGRIVSVLAFIIAVTFFNHEESIPILLLMLGAGHTLIYFFVRKVDLPI